MQIEEEREKYNAYSINDNNLNCNDIGTRCPKILLTGSSGSIGTRLFERLLELGYDVKGVDRRENQWNKALNDKTIILDLLKKNEHSNMPSDIDLIIHFAANARVYDLIQEPDLALENMITTFNVLDFARKNKINKIIFASSREVYGNSSDSSSIDEDRAKIELSESPYSASKVACEALIHAYGKTFGLDFVIVRFSNVYGLYDTNNRVIPLWIKQGLENKDIVIYGKNKVLDFTYIDDAIDGVTKAIEKFDIVKGETFNIASPGQGKELNAIANKIIKLLGSKSRISITDNRIGEVYRFQADISKAKEQLGYEPQVSLEEGLAKATQWYRRYYQGIPEKWEPTKSADSHNEQPLVSFVVTTKNEERNITNCLRSIKNQTYPKEKIEIIVVDNFSSDKTEELAKEFADKVYSKGPQRAAQLNFGVEKASGKYIFYPDADMILSRTLVADCVNKCENQGYEGLYIREEIVGQGFWIPVRDFERSFYTETCIDAVRFVAKVKFSEVNGFDEQIDFGADDWDFNRRLKQVCKVGTMNSQLYHNEGQFSVSRYIGKKGRYANKLDKYIQKWGANDTEIKKQFGMQYRLFGVFLENGKWKKVIMHPGKSCGLYLLRFMVGITYVINRQ